jgi:TrmH family RNA methyltransferase
MKRITSINNNLIRRVHALQQSTRRRMKEQRMVVEGYRLVRELFCADLPVEALFVTSRFMATDYYEKIGQHDNVGIYEVPEDVFATIADTESPQGVLALCPIPEISANPQKPLLLLIADQVRDPGNLGTMLRTAWAVGVSAIFLTPGTIDHTNPKVIRAAMGAHFYLPIIKGDWCAIQVETQETKVWVADATMGTSYDAVNWKEDVTIIIGGEAAGAGTQAHKLAASVHIPMQSTTESLNAAIACAVILFEAARQRRI